MAENLGPDIPPSLYYAMGVQYTENFGRDEQPYLYNGKEFIEAHGLNEYDSQARMYYAPIMRTTTMDPLAENYYHISPYAWCGNNPVNAIDLNGMDTVEVTYNAETDYWDLGEPTISEGDDVVYVTDQEGNRTEYLFSEGEYGERAIFLNLENTREGEDGYVLGVYHVSGAKEGGTGFYVTPGGKASNEENSGRRIIEGTYPIIAPHETAEWRYPGVGGKAVERGSRFHYGGSNPRPWSKGCFILFPNYKIEGGRLSVDLELSKVAAINFAHLMGGVGAINYQFTDKKGNVKNRIGVSWYPYGISNKLVLKSR